MLNSLLICKKANMLRSRGCGSLEELAKGEGIRLHRRDDFQDLLGMYICALKNRMIFLNGRLEEPMASMVLAHEIGPDQLHRDLAKSRPLQEFVLFDMRNRTEYEANAFAAHLLLPDEDVLEYLHSGMDLSETASILHVNINLLLIKLAEMNRLGMDLRLPFEPDNAFFSKIRV